MKCKVIQRRLLSIPDSERMPDNLRAHLAYCEACREWHDHLLLLEGHIPLLPVPRSNGKARLMRRLLHENATPGLSASPSLQVRSHSPTLPLSHSPTSFRSRTLLLGVAAALLLIALGWLGLQRLLQTAASPPSEPAAGLAVFITVLVPLAGAKSAVVHPDATALSSRHSSIVAGHPTLVP
jgi:hypothetical protein